MLNLWNPTGSLPWPLAILTAFFLGSLHGVTPDEHTWPITFSYSVGSYSTRGGARAGFLFSLAFTLQRALASELAYFALVRFLFRPVLQYWLYAAVGLLMLLSGSYVLRMGRYVKILGFLDRFHHGREEGEVRAVPAGMALAHGFLAGWGTGAFAMIVYTTLSPTMPSPALGFLPGLFFGLGTMITQILIGASLGRYLESRRLGERARAFIGRTVAGRTLFYGGAAFILAGLFGIFFPSLAGKSLRTPLHVHNLHSLGLGFILVVIVLLGIGLTSFRRALREVARRPEFRTG